jgi:hypothetical protein
MVESSSSYIQLATRTGFNASVRHINRTLDLLDACGSKTNVADEINRMLEEKEFDSEETQVAVHMLLVEKWKYASRSKNILAVLDNATAISEETAKWKAVDLVIGYHHPDLGFLVINPKNLASAALITGFRKNELMVLYAGNQSMDSSGKKNAEAALSALADLLEGKSVKVSSSLLNGQYEFVPPKKPAAERNSNGKGKTPQARKAKAAASQAAAPVYAAPVQAASVAAPVKAPAPVSVPGSSKMSPLISVVVSNELFHNGNVEAWKRIIRSYNAKYPNLQVSIYYDGERIVDINTLFKWGKVKHGSCIQFCVSGENIQDLAKLSRYFRQGASSQFEAFLHGSPDTVMNLF